MAWSAFGRWRLHARDPCLPDGPNYTPSTRSRDSHDHGMGGALDAARLSVPISAAASSRGNKPAAAGSITATRSRRQCAPLSLVGSAMKRFLAACFSRPRRDFSARRARGRSRLPAVAGRQLERQGSVKVDADSPAISVNCKFASDTTDNSMKLDGNCVGLVVFSRPIGARLKTEGKSYTGTYIGSGTGPAGLNGKRSAIRSISASAGPRK